MHFAEITIVLVLGLVFGSFSTALIYRVPRNLDWTITRSSCTSCKAKLGGLDLVPFFSWVFLNGKCRHCGTKVSSRYPLIELLVLLACVGIYINLGLTVESLFLFACIPFLMALLIIDLDSMLLPNQLVAMTMFLGFARLFYFSTSGVFTRAEDLFIPYIVGALLFMILSLSLRFILTGILKKDALGLGDVKFFFVSGLWLGLQMLPYFFICAGLMGVIMAMFWRIVKRQRDFPFGPALIVSMYALLLWQSPVLT